MITSERDPVRFIQKLQRLYLEQRDLEAVVCFFDNDIQWIGTGEGDICRGIEEVRKHLAMERTLFDGAYVVESSAYTAQPLSDDIYLINGTVTIREEDAEKSSSTLNLRVSAVCCYVANGMYLKQIHLSTSSQTQESTDILPKISAENNAALLRQLLDERTFELEKRSRDLSTLTNYVPGGILCCDTSQDLNIMYASDGLYEMLGYTRDEVEVLFENQFNRMIWHEDLQEVWNQIATQLVKGHTKTIEYRMQRKDGTIIWVLDRGQRVLDNSGNFFYCLLIDITESKEAKEELRLSLERYRIIMDQTTDIIFEWDIQTDNIIFSTNLKKKFGYLPVQHHIIGDLENNPYIHQEDKSTLLDAALRIKGGEHYAEAELRIAEQGGQFKWCRVRATAHENQSGIPVKAIGIILDIDAEMRKTQHLQERAERDTLTGLYNKGAARERMERYLATRGEEARAAIFVIDVDNFKLVNDTYGHLSGDAMLTDVAASLQKMFRSGDVVGRVGGDEFCIMMCNISGREPVEQRAQEILEVFRQMMQREGSSLVSCSIGIALVPEHGTEFDRLFGLADFALYQAKEKGKNSYKVFDQNIVIHELAAPCPRNNKSAFCGRIDSDRCSYALTGSHLAEYVFHVLYQSMDIKAALPLIMDIVGRQFDVSRMYIFEVDEDGQHISNTFEWCNTGVLSAKEMLQHLSCKELECLLKPLSDTGYFYSKDISKLSSPACELMESHNIKSILQCAIRDRGVFKGLIGFDECRSNRFWTQEQIDVLSLSSEIVSIFLLKDRAHQKQFYTLECIKSILDYQDAWIYVVEMETFKVLYANKRTLASVPNLKVGAQRCFEAFSGTNNPCSHCLICRMHQGEKEYRGPTYSPMLNQEVLVYITEIPWRDGPGAYLVSCHNIPNMQ